LFAFLDSRFRGNDSQIYMKKNAEHYMHRALELALKGWGMTSPNPMVGAVIVKGDRIIGEGYHHKAGSPHAEVNALRKAGKKAKGATIYVTLEPCCYHGRTPACTDAICEAGIKRVIIGTRDPNPPVNGNGIRTLKRAGIKVQTGVLKDACHDINLPYETFVTKNRPFVILKAALSLDGKIATAKGDSKWITNKLTRAYAHQIRSGSDAILVGGGTIRADNPALTVRLPGKKHDVKPVVVLDGTLNLPRMAGIFTRRPGELILATTKRAPKSRITWAVNQGYDVIVFKSMKHLLEELAKRDIVKLLVEGGGETYASFIKAKAVDHLVACIAPKLIGGEGRNMLPGINPKSMKDILNLEHLTACTFGEDIVIEGSPVF